jgi:surfeit locus 1 family protein
VLRLLPNDSTDLVREWKVMSMQPEKHLAYAIQWFGLAVAGLTIFLISLRKRSS